MAADDLVGGDSTATNAGGTAVTAAGGTAVQPVAAGCGTAAKPATAVDDIGEGSVWWKDVLSLAETSIGKLEYKIREVEVGIGKEIGILETEVQR